MQGRRARLRRSLISVAVIAVAALAILSKSGIQTRVAETHGFVLPGSARNFQHFTIGFFMDHGALSLFEIDRRDLQPFMLQLSVRSRHPPIKSSRDPRDDTVWPQNAKTFIPGNFSPRQIKATWIGEAKPLEMLSCASPVGDWLHVEVWTINDHYLIKTYTDWN